MRKLGDTPAKPVDDMVKSTYACQGAPDKIQPGAVVAMAEALEDCARFIENDVIGHGGPEERQARAALAMYHGEEK